MRTLCTSEFKPVFWGSDKSGWRIGPTYRVPIETKGSIERQGWIKSERGRFDDGVMLEWLAATNDGRRAYIAAGGNPGGRGREKRTRRR
jgi:hypothetical protein